MTEKEQKEKLIEFLDKNAFDPVINKSKDDYDSEKQKKKFEDVKRSTKSEKERFRKYESPEEVRDNFLADLDSEPAQEIDKELDDLDLPKLPDMKEDFLNLCDKIGVK